MKRQDYDTLQTKECQKFNSLIDGILWSISEIRKTSGPGEDKATDLLRAIIEDAENAIAVNDNIANNFGLTDRDIE